MATLYIKGDMVTLNPEPSFLQNGVRGILSCTAGDHETEKPLGDILRKLENPVI